MVDVTMNIILYKKRVYVDTIALQARMLFLKHEVWRRRLIIEKLPRTYTGARSWVPVLATIMVDVMLLANRWYGDTVAARALEGCHHLTGQGGDKVAQRGVAHRVRSVSDIHMLVRDERTYLHFADFVNFHQCQHDEVIVNYPEADLIDSMYIGDTVVVNALSGYCAFPLEVIGTDDTSEERMFICGFHHIPVVKDEFGGTYVAYGQFMYWFGRCDAYIMAKIEQDRPRDGTRFLGHWLLRGACRTFNTPLESEFIQQSDGYTGERYMLTHGTCPGYVLVEDIARVLMVSTSTPVHFPVHGH